MDHNTTYMEHKVSYLINILLNVMQEKPELLKALNKARDNSRDVYQRKLIGKLINLVSTS